LGSASTKSVEINWFNTKALKHKHRGLG